MAAPSPILGESSKFSRPKWWDRMFRLCLLESSICFSAVQARYQGFLPAGQTIRHPVTNLKSTGVNLSHNGS
jgi:hypothetical protein